MLLEPRAVVSCVVEDNIREAHESILLASSLENPLDTLDTILVAALVRILEQATIECHLVGDTVRAHTLAALLEWGVVKHVITASASLGKVSIPLG